MRYSNFFAGGQPQRLKPRGFERRYGTTKVVPFPISFQRDPLS
jgi:hypothetical protein